MKSRLLRSLLHWNPPPARSLRKVRSRQVSLPLRLPLQHRPISPWSSRLPGRRQRQLAHWDRCSRLPAEIEQTTESPPETGIIPSGCEQELDPVSSCLPVSGSLHRVDRVPVGESR
jgi:hypothetical protein